MHNSALCTIIAIVIMHYLNYSALLWTIITIVHIMHHLNYSALLWTITTIDLNFTQVDKVLMSTKSSGRLSPQGPKSSGRLHPQGTKSPGGQVSRWPSLRVAKSNHSLKSPSRTIPSHHQLEQLEPPNIHSKHPISFRFLRVLYVGFCHCSSRYP